MIPEKRPLYPASPTLGEEAVLPLWQIAKGRGESVVSAAARSPDGFWYDQDEQEWVAVLEGWATLAFPSGQLILRAGECVTIPAHLRHRVEETSADPPCRWLCVFY